MIIKDLRILKAIGLLYGLKFDRKFKYYIGDTYKTDRGLSTSEQFKYKNRVFELKYFDGCFNPFLIEVLK